MSDKDFDDEVDSNEEGDDLDLEGVEGDDDDDDDDDVARGFWGLIVEPGKAYSQVVEATFKLSNASLAATLPKDGGRTSVLVSIEEFQFTLCSLTPGKIEQAPLDHVFQAGEEISFQLHGKCPIHLTGYYLPAEDGEFQDGDYDFDDEDDDDEDDLLIEDDEEDEDHETGKIVELEEEEEEKEAPKAGQKRKANQAPEPPSKKQATGKTEKEQGNQHQEKSKEKSKEKQNQNQNQKEKEKEKEKEKPNKEAKIKEKKEEAEAKPKKQTLPNGLVIEETKEANGKQAKKGNTVFVQYTGKLASNGKVFDQSKGSPFKFVLGKGEVIKGWDLGIEGMAVGSERRLTIPANLAYGAEGSPPVIPKNAKLIFDVKLVNLK